MLWLFTMGGGGVRGIWEEFRDEFRDLVKFVLSVCVCSFCNSLHVLHLKEANDLPSNKGLAIICVRP